MKTRTKHALLLLIMFFVISYSTITCMPCFYFYASNIVLTKLTYGVEMYFLPPNGSIAVLRYQAYGNMVVKISSLYKDLAILKVVLNVSLHNCTVGYNCSLSSKLPYIRCTTYVSSVSVAQMMKEQRHVIVRLHVVVRSYGNLCSVNGTTLGFCPFYVYPLIILNSSTYKRITSGNELIYLGVPITGVAPAYLMYSQSTTLYFSRKVISKAIISMWTLSLHNRYLFTNIRGHYVVNARFVVPTKLILGRYVELLPKGLRDGIAVVYMDASYDTLKALKEIPYNIPHCIEFIKLPNGVTTTIVPNAPSMTFTRSSVRGNAISSTTSIASTSSISASTASRSPVSSTTSLASVVNESLSRSLARSYGNSMLEYAALGIGIAIAFVIAWLVLRKRV